tara:strand:- start:623 stop:1663 length:1041 start_codon:yes stop_codon:yes gene_type:complete
MGLNEKFFKSADENEPFFNTVLYPGSLTANEITGVGFSPDLVWLKQRNSAQNHGLFDTVRGTNNFIMSNSTSAENTRTTDTLSSFDDDGFTLTSYSSDAFINYTGRTMVAWCFKAGGAAVSNTDGSIASQVSANVANGFSIVKWTGLGNAGQTVGHGLSDAPELIITKSLNISGESWYTYSATAGNDKYLRLNSTSAAITAQQAGYSSGANWWNNTSPTNDVFSLGNIGEIMSYNHIAYCFHSVAGVSKVGSYVGNNNNIGPVVSTGFEPSFILIKASSRAGYWIMLDNKRNTSDPRDNPLYSNTNWAEDINQINRVNFDATGFQVVGTGGDVNDSGHTYIYLAIA